MESLDTLQMLVSGFGPAGAEGEISRIIQKLAAPWADEITTDVMGNLICRKKGNGPRLMLSAHMDTLGLVVTHIEDNGYANAAVLGKCSPALLLHRPVKFQNGARAVVTAAEGTEPDKLKPSDLLLDLGVSNKAATEKLVKIGDAAVWDAPLYRAGNKVMGPYLDNRLSCLVLLKTLKRLASPQNDLYFVFTVQEEVGNRGAKTAAWAVDPDYAITVDLTPADDAAGAKHQGSSICGAGAAVKILDDAVICDPAVVQQLLQTAKANGIPVQRDVLAKGGTDAGVIHAARGGVWTGGIGIPSRYLHTPTELVDTDDIIAAADLLAAFANTRLEG